MKKDKSVMKYKYLTTAVFIVLIFVLFFFNIKETAENASESEDGLSLRSIANDAETVESVIYPFININGFYQGVIQRNYMYDVDESNELVRKDGYLFSKGSTFDADAMAVSSMELKKTEEFLKQQGIPLIYVQAGGKSSISHERAMPGIPNNSANKIDLFMSMLRNQDLDCLDTREWIENGIEGFYKTDHHWTTGTCLMVSEKICTYLNENYNFDISPSTYGMENYDVKTNKDAFLGTEGRRTGAYYVGLDDFQVITPSFGTDLDVYINSKEDGRYERHGQFEKSVMDSRKDPENYSFDNSAYYIYWGGDFSSIHVENNKINNGNTIMVIKDSFGIPVTAYLACSFDSMDIIDVRYYIEEQTLKDRITETAPDAVVYIYGNGYLEKSRMFSIE